MGKKWVKVAILVAGAGKKIFRKYIYAEFVPVRVLVPYAELPSIYRDILENTFTRNFPDITEIF